MAKSIRIGVFETNSSSEHSFSVSICGYKSLKEYDCEPHPNIYLDENDIDNILSEIPLDELEKIVKWRGGEDCKKFKQRKPNYSKAGSTNLTSTFDIWFDGDHPVSKPCDPNDCLEDVYLEESIEEIIDYIPLELLKKNFNRRKDEDSKK